MDKYPLQFRTLKSKFFSFSYHYYYMCVLIFCCICLFINVNHGIFWRKVTVAAELRPGVCPGALWIQVHGHPSPFLP